MNQKIFPVLFLFFAATASAQHYHSLQEVIATAVENNYAIRLARNNQRISENNYSLGNAGFLPVIDLRGQYSGTRTNTDRTDFDGVGSSLRNIHNTVGSANLSLGWTIFDGFRVQYNYDKLEVLKEMGELSTEVALENLVAAITAEYFNLVQQQRLLDNLRFAVELSRERVRIDEERFLLGSGSKLQLLQAEVFLNADSSRMGRQEEVVRASRVRLNELMAMENLRYNIRPADTVISINEIMIYETLERSALSRNTRLRAAAKNKRIVEYDHKLTISQAYPYVNLSSGYGYTYNTFQTGTFSDQQSFGMNYGITVGMNIFDGFNRRRQISNAAINKENSRIVYEDVHLSVMSDLITIYNEYLNNFRLLDLETQNLDVAYETLNIAMERYRLGALSGFELREVQKNLLEAEERLLSIQYNTKLAEISLLRLAGRVLEYL
ncbi:MAG: TolC family protein [Bacteroidales bacterium]|nr:TolC family protein [Bacteroidales bacterium]